MKQFYSLLLLLIAAVAAQAQPPMPPAPPAGNANNCTTNATIDVCPPGGPTVVSANQGGGYNRGNTGDNLGEGAIWRFRNMAVVDGVTVNAEVRIDDIYNATLHSIDDDIALDQANVSILSFFSPRISPDADLNGSNRRGYVQFTMSFFKNPTGINNNSASDFATSVSLANINYVHYDIDGNDAENVSRGTAGSWFRETGVAKRISGYNPVIIANSQTELVGYSYTDAGTGWAGFAGSVYERDGVSRCAQIAASFSFNGSLPAITFRMGYDYNAGGNIGRPIRQYGSRLGCFNFPQQVTLPVKLTSFSGSYRNNQALLNWETENEVNFDRYELERSSNSKDFITVTMIAAKTGTSTSKLKYQQIDELSGSAENVFYYRLKMVDIDGKYSYSNVIMLRRDQKGGNGLLLSPNPVAGGAPVTIRLDATTRKSAEIRVIDGTGKLVLRQQNQLNEGINSIPINNQNRLQPGIYTIQVVADDEILSSKLSVIR